MNEENEILVTDFENCKRASLNLGDARNNMEIEIDDSGVYFEVELDLCYGSARDEFRISLDKLKELINKYEELTK
jgi:hypothetical protein